MPHLDEPWSRAHWTHLLLHQQSKAWRVEPGTGKSPWAGGKRKPGVWMGSSEGPLFRTEGSGEGLHLGFLLIWTQKARSGESWEDSAPSHLRVEGPGGS